MDSKVSARWLPGGVVITIHDDTWPVVASGSCRESLARAGVRIRRHADGRVIVCGTYDCAADESSVSAWVGLLIDEDADLLTAVRTVNEALARDARDMTGRDCGAHIAAAAHSCIENLLVN